MLGSCFPLETRFRVSQLLPDQRAGEIIRLNQDLRELLGPALDQERIRYQQGLGDLEPGQFIVDNRDLQPVNGSNSESHSGPPQANTGEHQAILSRK